MANTTPENPSMGHLLDLALPLAPQIGRNMGKVLADPEMVEFMISAYRSSSSPQHVERIERPARWYEKLLRWVY